MHAAIPAARSAARRRHIHPQRITAWQRCHISVSRFSQEAELKDIRAEFPAFAAIHSHVLQDVLAHLEMTYQAFFRRVQRGEKAGFPRFKGRNRFHSFTFKEYGNGVRLDNGFLVLSKIGRISVHWSRLIEGTPKTVTVSNEADGWHVAISCMNVPVQPLPSTGQETGIDMGLESFATLANGQHICTRVLPAKPKPICADASAASHGTRRAAAAGAKPWRCWRKPTYTSAISDATSTIAKPRSWYKHTT
jgi:transposase